MTGWLLRFSPHLETTSEDIRQIAEHVSLRGVPRI
jgi:hypothetical protein